MKIECHNLQIAKKAKIDERANSEFRNQFGNE